MARVLFLVIALAGVPFLLLCLWHLLREMCPLDIPTRRENQLRSVTSRCHEIATQDSRVSSRRRRSFNSFSPSLSAHPATTRLPTATSDLR